MPRRHRPRDTIRPQEYQGIDWSSAQAVGLRHLWPLDGRSYLGNLVTGEPLTMNAGSSYRFDGHPILGHSLYLPITGNNYSMLIAGLADLPAPWTFNFWWQRVHTGTSVAVMTSKTGSTIGVRSEQYNNTSALGYSAAGTDYSSGHVTPLDQAVAVTYVQTATDVLIYVDGILRGTLTTAGAVLTLSRIGNYADSVALATYGFFGQIGVWARAFSPSEVAELVDPRTRWDLLWTPDRARVKAPSATTTVVSLTLAVAAGLTPTGLLSASGSTGLSVGATAGPGSLGTLAGATTFGASAAMTATAIAQLQAAVTSLVAAVSQVATSRATMIGVAPLALTGTLVTPQALARALGLLALAASGGLTQAGSVTLSGTVPLAVSASLTPAGTVVAAALVALAAQAQLTALAADEGVTSVTLLLAAHATVAVTSLQLALAVQTFLAGVGLSAAPQTAQASALALAILANLDVTARLLSTGTLALALTGLATPSAAQTGLGAVTLPTGAGVEVLASSRHAPRSRCRSPRCSSCWPRRRATQRSASWPSWPISSAWPACRVRRSEPPASTPRHCARRR